MPFDLAFTFSDTPPGDYTDLLTLTLTHTIPAVNAAPAGVWFEVASVTGATATGPSGSTYDPQFHDITYLWDFDDAANATPTVVLNMPNEWKDLNKAYGRNVGHVFNDHGTYTVTCYAYEPATRRFGSKTVSVTIGNPATVFPTTQTIIYDPNDTAVTTPYPGATVIGSTDGGWPAVLSARNAHGYTNDCRILLASDVLISGVELIRIPAWSNVRLGPVDPTLAKPVIHVPSGSDFSIVWDKESGCMETVFYGIDIRGAWDSTIETGEIQNPFRIDKFQNGFSGTYCFTAHRCNIDGILSLKGVGNRITSGQAYYNFFSELDITNWQSYGIYGGEVEVIETVVGCSIHQHGDALSGGNKSGMYNAHGSYRSVSAPKVYVGVCDLFSRNGWSNGGTSDDGYSLTADQACLRVNTSGALDVFANFERIASEGAIWMEQQNQNDAPGNFVFDKVLQVMGSHITGQAVSCRSGGTTFRNFLGIKLGGPQFSATVGMNRFFTINNQYGVAGNADIPIKLHNITFVDLRVEADITEVMTLWEHGAAPEFTAVTDQNNIIHQPNRDTPVDGDAPIDITTAIAGFAPRHRGMRRNFLHQIGVFAGDVLDGGTLTIPYSEIKDTVYNRGDINDGTATDQAYWLAISEDSHAFRRHNDAGLYLSKLGQFAVSYGAAVVTITNNSGTTWLNGDTWNLRLDRHTLIEAWTPALSSVGKLVPTCIPQAGSAAINSGDTGLSAYDDSAGTERPATGNERGVRLV